MPAIIISQTMVAAAARRSSTTRLASSTRTEVPDAPTPTPIIRKASTASAIPLHWLVVIQAVASAASRPPVHRIAMPPMIQGVARPETSEP